jgi:4-hydroxy-2-oxoheptanedioate aldolase
VANPFGEKLRRRERSYGTHVFSPDPAHTEILGLAGYDFALIDTEHAALTIPDVVAHVRAAAAVGLSTVVRVRTDEPANVARFLDTGTNGIVFPHVGLDLERTRAALDALRYAPVGARPTCTAVPAAQYGLGTFSEYANRSNDEVLAIGLIEDADVIERIDEVLDTCRLDAVFAGPGDLATSYGVHGQHSHPIVVSAVRRVIEAAKRRPDLRVGVYVVDAAAAEAWSSAEVDFFLHSIDYRVLARAYEQQLAMLQRV